MITAQILLAQFWGSFWLRPSNAPHRPLEAFPSGFTMQYGPGFPAGGSRAELPYITFDDDETPFGEWTIMSGRIWTRSQTWGVVNDVWAQAREKIPNGGGILLSHDNGTLHIMRSNPFLSRLPPEDGDELNKAGVMRIVVENYIY